MNPVHRGVGSVVMGEKFDVVVVVVVGVRTSTTCVTEETVCSNYICMLLVFLCDSISS